MSGVRGTKRGAIQVNAEVRLKAKKARKYLANGHEVELEGGADGFVIASIGKGVWGVRVLNGTPGGVVVELKSSQLVLKASPAQVSAQAPVQAQARADAAAAAADATTTAASISTAATAATATATSTSNTSSTSKKGKKKSVYPTALELIGAYESDSLVVHPSGIIQRVENVVDDNCIDEPEDNSEDVDANEIEEDNLEVLAMAVEAVLEGEEKEKYQEMRRQYELEKEALLNHGYRVTCKDKREWEMVANSKPEPGRDPGEEHEFVGVKGFKFDRLNPENKMTDKHALLDLWHILSPGDPEEHLRNMNKRISYRQKKGEIIAHISEHEYWVFIGLLIIAGALNTGGEKLWATKKGTVPAGYQATSKGFNADDYMSIHRFNQLKQLFAKMFKPPHAENSDWSEIQKAVEGFNKKRKIYVSASAMKVLDEMMCAWCPRKTKTGGLPHLSFILRKPKPLGKSCGHLIFWLTQTYSHFLIFLQVLSLNQLAVQRLALCFI